MTKKKKSTKKSKATPKVEKELTKQEIFTNAKALFLEDRTNEDNRQALIIARNNLLNINQ